MEQYYSKKKKKKTNNKITEIVYINIDLFQIN